MKKHEACFHLISIANDLRRSLAQRKKAIEDGPVDKSVSEEKKAAYARWNAEAIEELEMQLLALDMAGTALTR